MFSQVSIDSTAQEATMSAGTDTRTELAHRANDGIEVWLYWEKVGDTLTLELHDARDDAHFQLDVPRDRAMDAFRHPFVYLAAAEAADDAALAA